MPISYSTNSQKAEPLALLRRIATEFLLSNASEGDRAMVNAYLEWLSDQRGILVVSAKLEAEGPVVRITIDAKLS